jgi:hypothetical protein
VTADQLTLPDLTWLLVNFDPETGAWRRPSMRYGNPIAAVACATLIDLLAVKSISITGTKPVKYASAIVYPLDAVPTDSGLARGHAFICGQRKPRPATWFQSKLVFAVDLPASLATKGLVDSRVTGRHPVLTPAGLERLRSLRSGIAGDASASLAAVLVRGDLLQFVFPDVRIQDVLIARSDEVSSAYLPLLDVLGLHNTSVGG